MKHASRPPRDSFERFEAAFRGAVVTPDDGEYDDARSVWNRRIDRHPDVVVRPTGVADVLTAVNYCRENDVQLAVRAGGHSIPGYGVCDGGVVVDLSAMSAVRVAPDARTAWVEGGATWGAFNHEAQAFGLAAPGITDDSVGVAGYTLGGGIGPLCRRDGLAIDALRSVTLVTADGALVRASETEHSDLFWALRGGGGNFGVVTEFEFALAEVGPTILGGSVMYRLADAKPVLDGYRRVMADAPDELQSYASIVEGSPEFGFPEELHGESLLVVSVTYAGDHVEGVEAAAPLRELGDPVVDAVEPSPYNQSPAVGDAALRSYYRSLFLDEFGDEAVETLFDHSTPLPSSHTMIAVGALEGAVGRVDPTATAFPHRDAPYVIGVFAHWTDPADDEDVCEWARDLTDAMAPYSTGGEYVNNQPDDGEAPVRAAYGRNYDRLAAVKAEWDPENLFSVNQNVGPAA